MLESDGQHCGEARQRQGAEVLVGKCARVLLGYLSLWLHSTGLQKELLGHSELLTGELVMLDLLIPGHCAQHFRSPG